MHLKRDLELFQVSHDLFIGFRIALRTGNYNYHLLGWRKYFSIFLFISSWAGYFLAINFRPVIISKMAIYLREVLTIKSSVIFGGIPSPIYPLRAYQSRKNSLSKFSGSFPSFNLLR